MGWALALQCWKYGLPMDFLGLGSLFGPWAGSWPEFWGIKGIGRRTSFGEAKPIHVTLLLHITSNYIEPWPNRVQPNQAQIQFFFVFLRPNFVWPEPENATSIWVWPGQVRWVWVGHGPSCIPLINKELMGTFVGRNLWLGLAHVRMWKITKSYTGPVLSAQWSSKMDDAGTH